MILQSRCCVVLIAVLCGQPGLLKIRTSVHFLCDTVLCTFLHVSPQFQSEMSTEGALKHRLNMRTLAHFIT